MKGKKKLRFLQFRHLEKQLKTQYLYRYNLDLYVR